MPTNKPGAGQEPPAGLQGSGLPEGELDVMAGQPEQDAGQVVATMYETHYLSLVRLAALLVADLAAAEDIVQDSFAAVHDRWHALPDTDAALCYLRRSVIHRSRSAHRVKLTGGTRADGQPGSPFQGSEVVSALGALPPRQREILVLRYFADLSEAEVASATGTSPAAVRNHVTQAMSALHAGLHPAGE